MLEFPRHVHKPSLWGQWVFLVVHNQAECDAALAEGWSLTPILLTNAAGEVLTPPVESPAPKRGRKR